MEFTLKNFFLSTPLEISILVLFVILFITIILPKLQRNEKIQNILDDYIKESAENILPEIEEKLKNILKILGKFDLEDLERFKISLEKDIRKISYDVNNIFLLIKQINQFLDYCSGLIKQSNISDYDKMSLVLEIKNLKEMIQRLERENNDNEK